jgi:putative transposase
MKERGMELREIQEMLELKRKLESQEYFTFSQAARLMGVSRQYVYKLVKEDKLRASRLSSRMSLIRRSDIELMLKTKPYKSIKPKDDVDITEYYTAEQIAEKYKVNTK